MVTNRLLSHYVTVSHGDTEPLSTNKNTDCHYVTISFYNTNNIFSKRKKEDEKKKEMQKGNKKEFVFIEIRKAHKRKRYIVNPWGHGDNGDRGRKRWES
jgi:hypothetical protein